MGTPVSIVDEDNKMPSAANPFPVGFAGYSASASFTPAANEHTAGDAVGVAAEFALAAPTGALLRIVNASLLVAGGTQETSTWRLYLFSVTPPSALTDGGAFVLASGDRASFLGYFDFAQLVDVGDTLYIEATPSKVVRLTGTSVFGYLVNLTTLTPAAVAHTVRIHAIVAPD